MALDFTGLLWQGECALVGSSAKLLALVHGETIEGELVPAVTSSVPAGSPAHRTTTSVPHTHRHTILGWLVVEI